MHGDHSICHGSKTLISYILSNSISPKFRLFSLLRYGAQCFTGKHCCNLNFQLCYHYLTRWPSHITLIYDNILANSTQMLRKVSRVPISLANCSDSHFCHLTCFHVTGHSKFWNTFPVLFCDTLAYPLPSLVAFAIFVCLIFLVPTYTKDTTSCFASTVILIFFLNKMGFLLTIVMRSKSCDAFQRPLIELLVNSPHVELRRHFFLVFVRRLPNAVPFASDSGLAGMFISLTSRRKIVLSSKSSGVYSRQYLFVFFGIFFASSIATNSEYKLTIILTKDVSRKCLNWYLVLQKYLHSQNYYSA